MFEVIEELTSSIKPTALLYLNLPPNLFTSIDLEYCVSAFETPVFKFSASVVKFVL